MKQNVGMRGSSPIHKARSDVISIQTQTHLLIHSIIFVSTRSKLYQTDRNSEIFKVAFQLLKIASTKQKHS